MLWATARAYTIFMGTIAHFVYQLKLTSAILDNQPKIIANEAFLKNYSLQLKTNKFLEKIWSNIKYARRSGISNTTYKIVNIAFLFPLLLQFFRSDSLSFSDPAIFLSLGVLAAALQDKKQLITKGTDLFYGNKSVPFFGAGGGS